MQSLGASQSAPVLGDQYLSLGMSKLTSERKRETQRLLAKRKKAKEDQWCRKGPVIAGSAIRKGGAIERLCNPDGYTGCYRREDRGNYKDPVRTETTKLLMNKSSRKGELSAKANAQNFRNEVEWRLSLQERTEVSPSRPVPYLYKTLKSLIANTSAGR